MLGKGRCFRLNPSRSLIGGGPAALTPGDSRPAQVRGEVGDGRCSRCRQGSNHGNRPWACFLVLRDRRGLAGITRIR